MPYRVTQTMLDAGALALERCASVSAHTPQTTAHAVFNAMMDAADVTPGKNVRNTFRRSLYVETGVTQSRPDIKVGIETYAGLRIGDSYLWHAWDAKHRLHYFRNRSQNDWIRLADRAWDNPDFMTELEAGRYRVHHAIVVLNAKKKWITQP